MKKHPPSLYVLAKKPDLYFSFEASLSKISNKNIKQAAASLEKAIKRFHALNDIKVSCVFDDQEEKLIFPTTREFAEVIKKQLKIVFPDATINEFPNKPVTCWLWQRTGFQKNL